nr:hypothetical protein [Pseudacidovorax sp.]
MHHLDGHFGVDVPIAPRHLGALQAVQLGLQLIDLGACFVQLADDIRRRGPPVFCHEVQQPVPLSLDGAQIAHQAAARCLSVPQPGFRHCRHVVQGFGDHLRRQHALQDRLGKPFVHEVGADRPKEALRPPVLVRHAAVVAVQGPAAGCAVRDLQQAAADAAGELARENELAARRATAFVGRSVLDHGLSPFECFLADQRLVGVDGHPFVQRLRAAGPAVLAVVGLHARVDAVIEQVLDAVLPPPGAGAEQSGIVERVGDGLGA